MTGHLSQNFAHAAFGGASEGNINALPRTCGSFVLFWDVGHDGRSSGKRLSCQILSKCTKKGSFTVWVAAQALTFSSNPYCFSSVCSAMLLLFCCLCLTVKHCSAVNVDVL